MLTNMENPLGVGGHKLKVRLVSHMEQTGKDLAKAMVSAVVKKVGEQGD